MKVYVFCHNAIARPTGGVKVLFEIADGLLKAGYDAYVLIPGNLYLDENPSNFRPAWFDSDVQVVNDINILTKDDIVFIHEEATWAFYEIKKNNPRHIMINQGAQCTLCIEHIDYKQTHMMYSTALGVVSVSDYINDTLNTIFDIPYSKLFTVNNINLISKMFAPGIKKNKICYIQKISSKDNIANKMMVKIMEQRYPGWEVEKLTDRPQEGIAKAMAESKIFVFFCHDWGEGFGIPPVEAAISGCKVIGYSGHGGRHYYEQPTFTEIEYNDVNVFTMVLDHWVKALENISMLEYNEQARQLHQKLSYQRDITLFHNDVKTIMEKILNGQQNV